MKCTRCILLAILVAFLLLLGPVPAALAMEQWCEEDPPVLILTPSGSSALVFVTNGALGLEHLPAVQLAQIRYTVQPVESGRATLVKMTVVVPPDIFSSRFPTRSTVSSGPFKTGTIYATASGYSGEPMEMTFQLSIPY
jgi:hypothetical protein